jgi:hypothetical protein
MILYPYCTIATAVQSPFPVNLDVYPLVQVDRMNTIQTILDYPRVSLNFGKMSSLKLNEIEQC